MAEIKELKEAIKAEAAWGGIGGSGKHAPEMLAELSEHPDRLRAVTEILSRRDIDAVISRAPEAAWGGIGGSGRHAAELEPEVLKQKGLS